MEKLHSLTSTYTLSNGVKIPCVGFGTWQVEDGDVVISSVKAALEAGYRHVDTAAVYGNEDGVGKAIKDSGIPREEIFLTTKLWNTEHGYESTIKAFHESLKKLDTSYVDLYLIHWPNPIKFRDNWQEANAESWRAMEDLYNEKKIRAIGVSNFMPRHLEALEKTAQILPMVNQIRLCPGETQQETVTYCRERDMLIEAYSPLGTGAVFELAEMKALADKYGKSIAQVCLRWSLQMGFLPLPKSVTPERIRENAAIFDFELTAEDVAAIAAMTDVCGPSKDPDTVPF